MKFAQKFNGIKIFYYALLFLILIPSVCAASTYSGDQKVFGKVRPDKALVYFIVRPNQRVTRFFICDADKQVLTVLKDDSYSFTYLDPGEHFICAGYIGNRFEFVPGHTYYLDLNKDQQTLLHETEGVELLKNIKNYKVSEPEELEDQVKYMKIIYPKLLKMEQKQSLISLGEISSQPSQLVQGTVDIQIPKYTQIKLQLVENISSLNNVKGEIVPFRIIDDVVIDNQVCFRGGTIVKGHLRQCKRAGGFATSGVLDVVISEVPSTAGTLVPVIGRVLRSGASRAAAEFTMGIFLGVFGEGITRGNNSTEFCGTPLIIWVRNDTWIKTNNTNFDSASYKENSISVTPITVEAKWLVQETQELTLSLYSDREIKEIKIGGNKFCSNLNGNGATVVNKGNGRWEAVFKAWDIIRYVDFRDSSNKLQVCGKFIDNTSFIAELQVEIKK